MLQKELAELTRGEHSTGSVVRFASNAFYPHDHQGGTLKILLYLEIKYYYIIILSNCTQGILAKLCYLNCETIYSTKKVKIGQLSSFIHKVNIYHLLQLSFRKTLTELNANENIILLDLNSTCCFIISMASTI